MIYSSIGTYVLLTYMPSYLQGTIHLSPATAQIQIFIAGALLTVSIPFAGALSDRLGCKTMLTAAAVGYCTSCSPFPRSG